MGKKKRPAGEGTESTASETGGADPTTAGFTPPRTFQSFERMTAMRSQLRFHEQNPRSIDPHAFKKLKESLKRTGLVSGICVNRRVAENGFPQSQHGQLTIVGGHQRCKAMDELQGFGPATAGNPAENDYQIPIDLVCISPAKERELLISLNNSALMGAYDLDILGDLLTFPELDWKATGFDKLEIRNMLDSGICDQILGEETPQAAAESPVIAAIAEIAADSKEFTKAQQAAAAPAPAGEVKSNGVDHIATSTPPASAPGAAGAQPPAKPDINSVEAIKGRRYDFRDKTSDAGLESHLTLVANDPEELAELCANLGLPVGETFCDLGRFIDALSAVAGVDLSELLGPAGGADAGDGDATNPAGDEDLQESAAPS